MKTKTKNLLYFNIMMPNCALIVQIMKQFKRQITMAHYKTHKLCTLRGQIGHGAKSRTR